MQKPLIMIIVMLLLMLAGAQDRLKAEAKNTKLDEYKKHLERLDPSNIESILIAKAELISNFKSAGTQPDAALRMFLDFYSKTIDVLKKDFLNQREYQTVLNQTGGLRFNPSGELQKTHARAIITLQKYKECGTGFVGLAEDAGWDLRKDPDYVMQLARQFGGPYSEFLIFYSDETRQSFGSDANLNLTWDELRIKIIRWEQFAKKHQQLPETETSIKPMIQNMLSLYIEGMDNTPAYDARIGGTGKINEELKTSYIKFLKENKDSQYYDLIQGVYTALRKHNFALNRELISFVHDNNIAAFEGTSVREFVEKNSR